MTLCSARWLYIVPSSREGCSGLHDSAARGWNVIAAVRIPEEATALHHLAKEGGRVRIEHVDVIDSASVVMNALGLRSAKS